MHGDPLALPAGLPALARLRTTGGKVILEGNVRSWAEWADAERAAWAAPGVKEVDDRLVVSAATF